MSVLLRTVLQGRQPKLMPLMHSVRLLLTELNGTEALHNLLRDDVAPPRGLGKKKRVISMDVLTISEPSEAATFVLKLPHARFLSMLESGRSPTKFVRSSGSLMIRSIQNLDVLRVPGTIRRGQVSASKRLGEKRSRIRLGCRSQLVFAKRNPPARAPKPLGQ